MFCNGIKYYYYYHFSFFSFSLLMLDHTHIIHTSYTYHTYIRHTSYTHHTHIRYTSYTHHTHIIHTSYTSSLYQFTHISLSIFIFISITSLPLSTFYSPLTPSLTETHYFCNGIKYYYYYHFSFFSFSLLMLDRFYVTHNKQIHCYWLLYVQLPVMLQRPSLIHPQCVPLWLQICEHFHGR